MADTTTIQRWNSIRLRQKLIMRHADVNVWQCKCLQTDYVRGFIVWCNKVLIRGNYVLREQIIQKLPNSSRQATVKDDDKGRFIIS